MTRDEAISVLEVLASFQGVMEYLERQSVSVQDACNMAIKALSQEPCDDAISRQAVINAIENDCMKGGLGSCFACYNDAQAFRGEIEKLPSVNSQPCDDAISRDAVIEKLNEWDWQELYLPIHFKEHIIDELPSVTQKSGKWIETEYHRWRCSVCREKGMSEWDNIHNVRTNFCPNCGADMRGAE